MEKSFLDVNCLRRSRRMILVTSPPIFFPVWEMPQLEIFLIHGFTVQFKLVVGLLQELRILVEVVNVGKTVVVIYIFLS